MWIKLTKSFFLSLWSCTYLFVEKIIAPILKWIKNNKISAITFPIVCIIATIFNILKSPHTNECETNGDSGIFTYVMGLLSIILTLSISKILTNGNLFLKFIVDKYLKKEIKKDMEDIYYLYIVLMAFLLFFPIQYWYASYQDFHTKTDWSFLHVFLHMIAPIMFFTMANIVFPHRRNITINDYFNSKKLTAYFIITITVMNVFVDYVTLCQSTIFTDTNALRATLLPIILLLGIVRISQRRLLLDIFTYVIAIVLYVAYIYIR